jgi:RNA polymerase sigma factor (sigma-70 family)
MCPVLGQIDVDDLVSAGTVGLIEAVDRYDDDFGVPFASYAYFRIKGAITDEVFRLVGSRSLRDPRSEPLSLEAPLVNDRDATLMDVTVDKLASEPQRRAEFGELLAAARRLPRRQRGMLALSVAGHSVTEIAHIYGCSQSLASQLLLQARFRLEERTAA